MPRRSAPKTPEISLVEEEQVAVKSRSRKKSSGPTNSTSKEVAETMSALMRDKMTVFDTHMKQVWLSFSHLPVQSEDPCLALSTFTLQLTHQG
jgi:hypothetical protein